MSCLKCKMSWFKSMGVDQSLKWPYLLQKRKSPQFKGTVGFVKYSLFKDILFLKKGYKLGFFLKI